jgi:hypothetical protein
MYPRLLATIVTVVTVSIRVTSHGHGARAVTDGVRVCRSGSDPGRELEGVRVCVFPGPASVLSSSLLLCVRLGFQCVNESEPGRAFITKLFIHWHIDTPFKFQVHPTVTSTRLPQAQSPVSSFKASNGGRMIRVRAWQAALSHRRLSRVTGRTSTFPGAKLAPPPLLPAPCRSRRPPSHRHYSGSGYQSQWIRGSG